MLVPRMFEMNENPTPIPRGRNLWELELLISGALIFGLFQSLSTIDSAMWGVEPHLDRESFLLAFLFYYYFKLIVYTLTTTFLIHIASRAYWVGLLGLNRVFPGGVHWKGVRTSRTSKAFQKSRLPKLSDLTKQADRFCSLIFSFAFLIIFMFGVSLAYVALIGGGGLLVRTLLLPELSMGAVLGVALVAMTLPAVMTPLIARLSDRFPRSRFLKKLARTLMGLMSRLYLLRMTGAISYTFLSRVKRGLIYPVFLLSFFFSVGLFVVKDGLMRDGRIPFDDYLISAPDRSEFRIRPQHYLDQRSELHLLRTPYIQSDIVEGAYVKLFLPYSPRHHNDAVKELCPEGDQALPAGGQDPEREREAARQAVVCLAKLYRVELDEEPLSPDLDLSNDSGTGQLGLLAYLPTSGLSAGRHILHITRLWAPEELKTQREEATEEGDPLPVEVVGREYWIPFWVGGN